MAPNQEIFIAAASQVTSTIRLGPMVKLLPLHHPVRIIEDMCVRRPAHRRPPRLRRRPRSGADRACWFGSNWPESPPTLRGHARDHLRRLRHRRDLEREQRATTTSPRCRSRRSRSRIRSRSGIRATRSMAGRHGMNLMWPGPIDQRAYDVYAEAWHEHKGDTLRFDGPDAAPRVGCTMLLAIAPTEREALDIARRGMDGLVRRAAQRPRQRPPDHVRGATARPHSARCAASSPTSRTPSTPAPARPTRSPSGSPASSSPG